MCSAVADVIGNRLTGGIVVTKQGHAAETISRLTVVEAGHPIPDEAGLAGAQAIASLLRELNARDLLLVAISGGASALLPSPKHPVTLTAKQKTTDLLLRAGADIREINAVRKHLSLLKGGQFAALAYPATVVSLLLSDVIGDPLDTIGSGLTAPDSSTFADALAVLRKYSLEKRVPASVLRHLQLGAEGKIAETPKQGDPLFENVHNVVVASNRLALQAAAKEAKRLGYRPLILSSTIGGETREAANVHAQIIREVIASGNPVVPPACILSGGETTVAIKGSGKGGRNQEFALAAALELAGLENVLALSAGTDGTDGPTDAAGAVATGGSVKEALAKGLHARNHLENNDSYLFFDAINGLVKTGPTDTNVMDLHLLLAR
jgi:hydroxypyruvate reductase